MDKNNIENKKMGIAQNKFWNPKGHLHISYYREWISCLTSLENWNP
jgi:hypothetical protein